jgi:hypothetical protein
MALTGDTRRHDSGSDVRPAGPAALCPAPRSNAVEIAGNFGIGLDVSGVELGPEVFAQGLGRDADHRCDVSLGNAAAGHCFDHLALRWGRLKRRSPTELRLIVFHRHSVENPWFLFIEGKNPRLLCVSARDKISA